MLKHRRETESTSVKTQCGWHCNKAEGASLKALCLSNYCTLGATMVCGRRPANSHIERPRARYVRTVRAAKNTLPQMHVPNADDSRNEH